MITEQLRKDHAALQEALNQAYTLGISSEEGRAKLRAIKADLLGHLAKEDKDLYPVLDRAAADDRRLRDMLANLRDEMALISKQAGEFFATYEQGGSGFGFARDFGRLSAALGSRIRREETVLFPEFVKLAAKP